MGREERFSQTRMNAGCGFRKETIVGMRRNGRDAPIPVLRKVVIELPSSIQKRTFPTTIKASNLCFKQTISRLTVNTIESSLKLMLAACGGARQG